MKVIRLNFFSTFFHFYSIEMSVSNSSTRKEIDVTKFKVVTPDIDTNDSDFETSGFELIKWIVFNVLYSVFMHKITIIIVFYRYY